MKQQSENTSQYDTTYGIQGSFRRNHACKLLITHANGTHYSILTSSGGNSHADGIHNMENRNGYND